MKTNLKSLVFLLSVLGIAFFSCNKETKDENGNENETNVEDWGAWTNIGSSNIEWIESPIVFLDDKLWHIAGEKWNENTSSFIFSNDVYTSADGLTWNEVNSDPGFLARSLHQTIVFNEKLFIVGGVRSDGFGSDVWSSSDGINWDMEASGQFSGRERFGMVEFNNLLWIFGGSNNLGELHQFTGDIFKSADGKNWEEVTIISENHPMSRMNFYTFVFNDKIWIIAGNSEEDYSTISTEVWNSSDGEYWELIDTIGLVDKIGDYIGMHSFVFDDKIWVMYAGKAYYSVDGKNWIKNKDEVEDWVRLLDVVVFNNSMYVFTEEGDVWQLKKK